MMNKGKLFEMRIQDSAMLTLQDAYIMRISDTPMGEKPGDFLLLTEEFDILLELKATANVQPRTAMVKGHQWKALEDFRKIGKRFHGILLYAVNDVCYAYHIDTVDRSNVKATAGYKIPLSYLGGKPVYDLKEIIKFIKEVTCT